VGLPSSVDSCTRVFSSLVNVFATVCAWRAGGFGCAAITKRGCTVAVVDSGPEQKGGGKGGPAMKDVKGRLLDCA
jgi:hypothetical protein